MSFIRHDCRPAEKHSVNEKLKYGDPPLLAYLTIRWSRRIPIKTYGMANVSDDPETSIDNYVNPEKSDCIAKRSIIAPPPNVHLRSPASSDDSAMNLAGNPTSKPSSLTRTGRNSRASSPQTPAAIEKPSMTKRITRMFAAKDNFKAESTPHNLAASATQNSPRSSDHVNFSTLHSPRLLSHKPSGWSSKSERAAEKSHSTHTRDKKVASTVVHQRFVSNPDAVGGHEHYLKSTRRQEKLSDMLRSVIGGRPKNEHTQEGEQQLSLVSNWVDQLKSERESLGQEKKSVNPATTLVEKYGKCQEIVGRGAFGIVRISHKRTEGLGEQLYAVKEFRRRPDETEKKYSKRLTSEFCISSSLRHPNVIHTLDLLQDAKGDYCEVMEFCAGGDLYTLILAAGKLDSVEADCYFKQMMRGVEYMHEMGVAHRDLKPENLLLTTRGSLKITDFGNGECFRMAWESDAHLVTGLCGSAPYIAPEEYIEKEFDARAVDVWATGVIYMAMRTGRHLWRVAKKEDDEFYERYLEGRRDEDGYAPIETLQRARCRNVIYSVLDPNPSRRITATQVLKSEWGREIQLCKAGEEGL